MELEGSRASSSKSARSTPASRVAGRLFSRHRAGRVPLHRPLVPAPHAASSRRSRSSCRAWAATTAKAIDRDQILMMQKHAQRRGRARAGRAARPKQVAETTPTTKKAAPAREPRAKKARWETRTPRTPATTLRRPGSAGQPGPAHRAAGCAPGSRGVRHDRPLRTSARAAIRTRRRRRGVVKTRSATTR